MDATGFTPLNGFSFHVNPGAGRTGTLSRRAPLYETWADGLS
jgi:hypothetical protein